MISILLKIFWLYLLSARSASALLLQSLIILILVLIIIFKLFTLLIILLNDFVWQLIIVIMLLFLIWKVFFIMITVCLIIMMTNYFINWFLMMRVYFMSFINFIIFIFNYTLHNIIQTKSVMCSKLEILLIFYYINQFIFYLVGFICNIVPSFFTKFFYLTLFAVPALLFFFYIWIDYILLCFFLLILFFISIVKFWLFSYL